MWIRIIQYLFFLSGLFHLTWCRYSPSVFWYVSEFPSEGWIILYCMYIYNICYHFIRDVYYTFWCFRLWLWWIALEIVRQYSLALRCEYVSQFRGSLGSRPQSPTSPQHGSSGGCGAIEGRAARRGSSESSSVPLPVVTGIILNPKPFIAEAWMLILEYLFKETNMINAVWFACLLKMGLIFVFSLVFPLTKLSHNWFIW